MDAASLTAESSLPLRCLSIDVEEYFHIEAARLAIRPADWQLWPSRVAASVQLLLELLARHDRRGTFFVLGDVARRCPQLAKHIVAAGHEIASHGFNHQHLSRLSPAALRADLLASKRLLEDQTGQPVVGYRAPTFSVGRGTAWAIDVLAELGFAYDASVFPVRHPSYGVPTAPDRPFLVQGRSGGPVLLELPPLTWLLPVVGRKLAVAGGGYFRLLPLWLMRRGLAQAARQGRPAVLYFHPWEFDPDLPRMPLPLTGRIRTYTGLRRSAARLECILRQPGRWQSIGQSLAELRRMAEGGPVFTLGKD